MKNLDTSGLESGKSYSLEELLDSLDPETRSKLKLGSETNNVPLGYLNGWDVCRLYETNCMLDGPIATARRIVREQSLPLMELETGKWVVTHDLGD